MGLDILKKKKKKKSPFRCNFILGAYFFANNKTKPPYIVAKSDNEQYVAARCRHHGSDLQASCGKSSDLVFRLKQQLNLLLLCHFLVVATLGILSRVFLFHFEKFLGHFSLFWVFRDVLINTGRNSRFGRYVVCA